MNLHYIYYVLVSIFSRLLPFSMSTFAEQTLDRYYSTRGHLPSFYKDKELPASRSIYWRLVRARRREKYFRSIAARYNARGLIMNSIHVGKWYFFAGMTWIGLSHSLPLSLAYLRRFLEGAS